MSANKPPLGDDEGVDRFYPSGHEDKLLVRRKLIAELDRQQREDEAFRALVLAALARIEAKLEEMRVGRKSVKKF